MVKLKGKITTINVDYKTQKPKIEIEIINQRDLFNEEFEKLQEKEIDIELKIHRKKRSLNANAYLWVLCDKIAKEINITKEQVYKRAINEVGEFEILPIKNEAVDKFITTWKDHGLGWICEKLGASKITGYTNIIAYYGSSTYDTKTMAILVEKVEEEAKSLGLQVISDEEIESLLKEYGG